MYLCKRRPRFVFSYQDTLVYLHLSVMKSISENSGEDIVAYIIPNLNG